MHEKIILAWLENDSSGFQYPDLYCFKSFETAFYAYFWEFIHGLCKLYSYMSKVQQSCYTFLYVTVGTS